MEEKGGMRGKLRSNNKSVQNFVGKYEGKRPLEKCSSRYDSSIDRLNIVVIGYATCCNVTTNASSDYFPKQH
jgi:hypothetical protein